MAHEDQHDGIRTLFGESAVQGVLLVSGLIVVLGDDEHATLDVLTKVIGTVLVFWAAHLYAGVVAHLGDEHEDGTEHHQRFSHALGYSLHHSWGMLGAAAVPTLMLLLGVLGVIRDQGAIWGVLWVDVALLAVLGFAGVASWSRSVWMRLAGAVVTAALGFVMILLKALIH